MIKVGFRSGTFKNTILADAYFFTYNFLYATTYFRCNYPFLLTSFFGKNINHLAKLFLNFFFWQNKNPFLASFFFSYFGKTNFSFWQKNHYAEKIIKFLGKIIQFLARIILFKWSYAWVRTNKINDSHRFRNTVIWTTSKQWTDIWSLLKDQCPEYCYCCLEFFCYSSFQKHTKILYIPMCVSTSVSTVARRNI